MDNKSVLKVEIQSLGFAGGAEIRKQAVIDLGKEIAKLLKDKMDSRGGLTVDGYILHAVIVSLCEQYDDLHSVVKDQTLVRGR